MRVLLDECLPRKLRRHLPSHVVKTVPEMGWSGLKNGELLDRAQTAFDVFVTIDQSLPYQQNLKARPIAVIILSAQDNRYVTLSPLMPRVDTALSTLRAGDVLLIDALASP